jgi:hypothetical protein
VNQVERVARSVLGRGLKPLMEEAQVVTGIPTLSVDPKSVARPETTTTTNPAPVTKPEVQTVQGRQTLGPAPASGPSIYPKKAQALPVGTGVQALPRWPFWVADIFLVGGAMAVWLLAPRPMSLGSVVLASLLIVVGAVVALVPWLNSPAASTPSTDAPSHSLDQKPPLQRLPFRLK